MCEFPRLDTLFNRPFTDPFLERRTLDVWIIINLFVILERVMLAQGIAKNN